MVLALSILLAWANTLHASPLDQLLGSILGSRKEDVAEIPNPDTPDEPEHVESVAPRPHGIAVLQFLDKVTARSFTVKAPVGKVTSFATLSVTPRVCHENPPGERPETTAFLEISEPTPEGTVKTYYSGWMFTASPYIAPLEHPIYDVVIKKCEKPHSPAGGTQQE